MFRWFSKGNHLESLNICTVLGNNKYYTLRFQFCSFSIKTPYGHVFLNLSYICDCECEKKENMVRFFLNCSWPRVQLLLRIKLIIDTDYETKEKYPAEEHMRKYLLFVIRICSFLLHRVTLPFGKLEHTGVQAVFEVMYKAGKTMPDNISKHREKSWEYDM